jgi:hypothetical protein
MRPGRWVSLRTKNGVKGMIMKKGVSVFDCLPGAIKRLVKPGGVKGANSSVMRGLRAGFLVWSMLVFPATVCFGSIQINCGDNITASCSNDAGASVTFDLPTATDPSCPNAPTVSASWPPYGTTYMTSPVTASFPIGVTPVTITASDSCGNKTTCTFTVTVLGGGVPTGEWAFADGVADPDTVIRGNSIIADPFGNVFVAGTFTAAATFTGTLPMYPSVNGGSPIHLYADIVVGLGNSPLLTDAFVAKYDGTGHLLWATNIGSVLDGGANGVAVDSQGNCFVTGFFTGGAFPSYHSPACGNGGLRPLGGLEVQDMFLAKYGPAGNLIWAVNADDVVNETGATFGAGAAVDTNGSCYVTGLFHSNALFQSANNLYPCFTGPPSASLTGNSDDQDAFLAKYDSGGNLLWVKSSSCASPTLDNAAARGVAVDSTAQYAYMVGEFTGGSGVQFGGLPALTTSSGFSAAFVTKYDASGNAIWSRRTTTPVAASEGNHDGRSIGVDANDNCYFTAYFNGVAGLDAFLKTVTDKNPGSGGAQLYDYLVGSFDPGGNPRWLVNGGRMNDNESRGLAVDAVGDVYVSGYRDGVQEYNQEGQNIMLNGYNGADGSVRWQTTGNAAVTPVEVNVGWSIAVDAAGCIYATGSFNDQGGSGFDPGIVFLDFPTSNGESTPLLAPYGVESMFVVKYCPVCFPPGSGMNQGNNSIMWLPFDETNTTRFANLASPANYGVPVNGPDVVLGAFVDNSLSFNGLNQFVTVPDYAALEIGTNDLTIGAWINRVTNSPDSPPSVILDKRDVGTGVGYSLSVSYGRLVLTLSDQNSQLSTNYIDTGALTVPADGQWHYVAVTLSQGTATASFYIDGVLNSASPVNGAPVNLANTNALWIGDSPLPGNGPWLGDLDELQVFNRALTAGEIQGIYDQGQAGEVKPDAYLQTLSISLAGSSIVVTWAGGAALETATAVTGPWSIIPNATSPFTNSMVGTASSFYRLVSN